MFNIAGQPLDHDMIKGVHLKHMHRNDSHSLSGSRGWVNIPRWTQAYHTPDCTNIYNLLSASDLAKNLDAAGYQACIHAWVVELLTDGKFMHGPCNTNVSDVRVTYHKLNILAGHNPEPWASSNYAAVPYILLLQQEISRHPIPRYIQRCCSR